MAHFVAAQPALTHRATEPWKTTLQSKYDLMQLRVNLYDRKTFPALQNITRNTVLHSTYQY